MIKYSLGYYEQTHLTFRFSTVIKPMEPEKSGHFYGIHHFNTKMDEIVVYSWTETSHSLSLQVHYMLHEVSSLQIILL